MARVQVGGRKGTLDNPLRCAIFISGSGTGMEAILACQEGEVNHTTSVVISNKADVEGITRAERFGIPTHVVSHRNPSGERKSREEHESNILSILEDYDIELVVLSGYMLILSPFFIERYAPHIVNIHPSLLPKFPGAHAHREVLEAKETQTGCTIHLVDEGMDTGQILAQTRVPIFKEDTVDVLSKRVKVEEHRLYPFVIGAIANGEIFLEAA